MLRADAIKFVLEQARAMGATFDELRAARMAMSFELEYLCQEILILSKCYYSQG